VAKATGTEKCHSIMMPAKRSSGMARILAKKYGSPKVSSPLFPNPQGGRMTTAALDLVVRKLGQEVGLQISPHVLRHTLVTNLVKGGNDLVLVAEIAGHEKVETTTRYSLSTAEDKEQALFRLVED
jgi:site-specific recombinase XerD